MIIQDRISDKFSFIGSNHKEINREIRKLEKIDKETKRLRSMRQQSELKIMAIRSKI